jgi:hypothetical protein
MRAVAVISEPQQVRKILLHPIKTPQPGLMTRQRCLCSPVRLPYSPLASIIGPSFRARLPRDAKPVTLHAARTPEPVTTETYNAGYQFSLEAVYSGRGAEGIRRQGRKRRNALD